MRAVVWHGPRDLRVDDVPEPPPPGPGQAVVRVAYCGICGTDLHEYVEGPVMIRAGAHPLTGCAPPLTLGHEISGRIEATGPDVDAAVGTRVTVDPCWRCGRCSRCRRGDYHLCKLGGAVGLASPGALAPLVTVPAAGLVPVPDDIDDRAAALAEPLAVGLHAVRRGGVGPGDRVLVQGFGPIGAAVVLAARAAGAGAVLVSEPIADRRERALSLGATRTLDPAVDDVRRTVRSATDGDGADVAFECTGVPALLPDLIETVRRGGRAVLVGVGRGHAELEPNRVVLFERELVGALGYHHDVERVVQLMASGRLDPSGLITGVVPLEDAVVGAFDALLADRGQHLKILVDVGGAE